jgi:hypothetical protein
MGGIMIRFVIAAFISILTIKGAFADINVFIAPNDLNYETNSTSEINHYLDELKKNNTKVDVDKDPKISNELKNILVLLTIECLMFSVKVNLRSIVAMSVKYQ